MSNQNIFDRIEYKPKNTRIISGFYSQNNTLFILNTLK